MARAQTATTALPSGATVLLPRSGQRLATFLINLDRAPDRLAAMESRLAALGLPFARVPAVDGRRLAFPHPDFSEPSYKLLHGRRTSPAEVGCYLSHVACARAFLEGDADLALILEDDAAFEPDLLDTLDRAALQPEVWDLLRLTTVSSGRAIPVRPLGNGRSLAIALTREKGSGAYLVNRRAARWIARDLVPMRLAYDIAYDLEYLRGLKAAFVLPMPASQIGPEPSQVQVGIQQVKLPRWRYLTVLPYRTFLEVSRLLCRGVRLLQARLTRPASPPDAAPAPAPAGSTSPPAPPPA